MRRIAATLVLVAVLIAGSAAAGGKVSGAACTVDGQTVTGTGLPTNQPISYIATDETGAKQQAPVGYANEDGTLVVTVDSGGFLTGDISYQLTSRQVSPSGKFTSYKVFAAC